MLNYFEFEGLLKKKYESENGQYFVLQGSTESGYPSEQTVFVPTEVAKDFTDIPLWSMVSVGGEVQTWNKNSASGFIRTKRVLYASHIIDVKVKEK